MTRFYLAIAFSIASLTGLALILYGALAGSRRREDERAVALGFSGAAGNEPTAVLDLDIGHEGLKHREKEPFDPDKHKPQPI